MAAIARASPDDRAELVENLRNSRPSARGQPASEKADPETEDESEEQEKPGEEPEEYIPSKASIRRISEAMASSPDRPQHETSVAFIIEELTDALETMIFRWDFCLTQNSTSAADKECRRQIQQLADQGKAYLKLYRGGKKHDAV